MRAVFVDESVGAGLSSLYNNHHRHVCQHHELLTLRQGYMQRFALFWSQLDTGCVVWVRGAANWMSF